MTVATEERLNMSYRRRRRRQQPQDWQPAEAAAAAAPPTRLWPPPPPPPTTTTTPEAALNRACTDSVEAEGLRARPTPQSSVDYREISSAPSSRSIQSGSIAPSSHTAASLRRQFGYTPRVQDTNTSSATHWVNRQTTQRPIVQLTGNQDPARASSLNSQH